VVTVATGAPASPDELKRARNRVRERQEWRQLRRMTGGRSADRPEGCNACRPERDKDKEPPVRQRSPAGCGALSQAFSGLSLVLVGLVIAALVGLLIWAIVKYGGGKDDDGKDADFGDEQGLALSPRTPPGERPASVYLKRALSLAEAGDFRGALRQLLLGAMSWTERKNLIRFRQGLTNRDYLRALRRRPTQRQGLQAVVEEFEKVYFGRRPATAARFERVLPGYRHGFEGGDDRFDDSNDSNETDDDVRSDGGDDEGRPGERGRSAAAAPATPGA